MPPIFKALASISAWGLFILGWITLLTTTINWAVFVGFIGEPGPDAWMGWGVGTVQLILAVVCMKLRKALE